MDPTIGLVTGAGWASGVNLYLTVTLLSLAGRAGVTEVPAALERTDVLVLAAALAAVEFLADKVPFLDSLWDLLHTVVRPAGAAALGALLAGDAIGVAEALGQSADGLLSEGPAAALSGGTALLAHGVKATTRIAVNASPEPASNVVVSLLEDGVVAGVVALAIAEPTIALIVVGALLVLGVGLSFALIRLVRRGLGRLRERRRGAPPAPPRQRTPP